MARTCASDVNHYELDHGFCTYKYVLAASYLAVFHIVSGVIQMVTRSCRVNGTDCCFGKLEA